MRTHSKNDSILILESADELPNELIGQKNIVMDFETTSGNVNKKSLNPHRNCYPLGVAISSTTTPHSYYIPMGHRRGLNIANRDVAPWLYKVLNSCESWINHGIKYDAHVLINRMKFKPTCRLVDTLTLSKVVNSDMMFNGGYTIDNLAEKWFGLNIKQYEDALKQELGKSKDYSVVSIDTMGIYAAWDVKTVKVLWKYLLENIPEESRSVCTTEIKLTSMLVDMEQRGMMVDMEELNAKLLVTLAEQYQIVQKLKELVGYTFEPHVQADCYAVICETYGLPVLRYGDETKKGKREPSFNADTLKAYLNLPEAPQEVLKLMMRFRKLNTLKSLFINKFMELQIEGVIHSSYNQAVRTGRMSCKDPNAQQNNKDSKKLQHPRKDHIFVSWDYSQIEYRFIVHYTQDEKAIKAYNEDPYTDYHTWVSIVIECHRKPAKTLNFLLGYGGGKELLLEKLSAIPEISEGLADQIAQHVEQGTVKKSQITDLFQICRRRKAETLYNKYHENLPNLKAASYAATRKAKKNGYVTNLAGRRRHLEPKIAHIAFNSANQSSAADFMKDRMVAAYDYIKEKGYPMYPVAQVHDELMFEVPTEWAINNPGALEEVNDILEENVFNIAVPIKTSVGFSVNHWAGADPYLRMSEVRPLLEGVQQFNSIFEEHFKCQRETIANSALESSQ